MTAAIELAGVSKSYGEGPTLVHALHALDLSVEAGELVAIMGPSGSGKSTLLTTAGALEQPTTGTVTVVGREVSAMTGNDRARVRRRSIGFVFQDFNLLAGLTAVENVSLPLELDGTRDQQSGLTGLRNGVTAVGMLFALAILAMTVGLIRSAAAADVRTLTATVSGREPSAIARQPLT